MIQIILSHGCLKFHKMVHWIQLHPPELHYCNLWMYVQLHPPELRCHNQNKADKLIIAPVAVVVALLKVLILVIKIYFL